MIFKICPDIKSDVIQKEKSEFIDEFFITELMIVCVYMNKL